MSASPNPWKREPSGLQASASQVDIWRFQLDRNSPHTPGTTINEFAAVLSTDEQARADRFKIEAKQREFIIGRGLTRCILARLLHLDPKALQFGYGPHGKPFLKQPDGGDALQFNLTHSHDWLLLAVTLGRAIGIDIEKQRVEVDIERLAERFFSPAEAVALSQLNADLQRAAFFRCWSRKEAVIKAVGRGVSLGLSKFDVSLAPNDPAALLDVRWEAQLPRAWTLIDLDVAPDYSDALAIEAIGPEDATLELRRWDGGLGRP